MDPVNRMYSAYVPTPHGKTPFSTEDLDPRGRPLIIPPFPHPSGTSLPKSSIVDSIIRDHFPHVRLEGHQKVWYDIESLPDPKMLFHQARSPGKSTTQALAVRHLLDTMTPEEFNEWMQRPLTRVIRRMWKVESTSILPRKSAW